METEGKGRERKGREREGRVGKGREGKKKRKSEEKEDSGTYLENLQHLMNRLKKPG